jgi:hypothetical protein
VQQSEHTHLTRLLFTVGVSVMQRGGLDPRQVAITGHEARCLKIVKELQSLQSASLIASDAGFASVGGYENLIPHPISLESVSNRINGKGTRGVQRYTYLNDFATDVRRIFGNFVRFNYHADAQTVKMRKDVLKALFKFEQMWLDFTRGIDAVTPGMYFKCPLPELKWCLLAFEEVVKCNMSVQPGVLKHLVDDFIFPIHIYYASGSPEHKEYCSIVARPISFAEIVTKFTEAQYSTLEQVKDDVDLLVDNCSKFWSRPGKEDLGPGLIAGAMRLQEAFLKSLKSSEAELRAKPSATSAVSLMPQLRPTPAAVVPVQLAAPAPVLTLSLGAKGSKGKLALTASTSAGIPVSGTDSAFLRGIEVFGS